MITIIPALLTNDSDERLLHETVRNASLYSPHKLVLITQGRRPRNIEYQKLVDCSLYHSDKPLSKWNAIQYGLEQIDAANEKIVLLDADNPFEAGSLVRAYEFWDESEAQCLLGKRSTLALKAEDQLSNATRLVVEIITNTLLLMQHSATKPIVLSSSPDIQNCLYMLNSKLLKGLDFAAIGNYGGEVYLFNYLSEKNIPIQNIPITPIFRNKSNYSVKEIIRNLSTLPFLKNADMAALDCACKAAPLVYGEYVDEYVSSKYKEESAFFKSVWLSNDDKIA